MTLADFIRKAKVSGYASGGDGQEKKFDDGSMGFELVAGGYRYLDRYNGFNPFAGVERIYDENASLIWIMHYYGEVLPDHSAPNNIYSFLREAMLLITSDNPFRGPAKFEKDNLRYENLQAGNLDSFHGVESICENNEQVYVLYYHGGKMNKRR